MPHRTRGRIWAGRALAAAAAAGLGGYLIAAGATKANLIAAGTTRVNLIAAPAALVIALAALLSPYLLPTYTPPPALPPDRLASP